MTAPRTHDFRNLNRNRMFRVSAQGAEKSSFFALQACAGGRRIPYLLNQKVKP